MQKVTTSIYVYGITVKEQDCYREIEVNKEITFGNFLCYILASFSLCDYKKFKVYDSQKSLLCTSEHIKSGRLERMNYIDTLEICYDETIFLEVQLMGTHERDATIYPRLLMGNGCVSSDEMFDIQAWASQSLVSYTHLKLYYLAKNKPRIIMIYGVWGVGKTTLGKRLSEMLHFDFYDLEEEAYQYYQLTSDEYRAEYWWPHTFDQKMGEVLKILMKNIKFDSVIAVTPMYYTLNFSKYINYPEVISIKLLDDATNIVKRFEEKFGEINYDLELKAIQKDITHYKVSLSKIPYDFYMYGEDLETCSERFKEEVERLLNF